MFFYEIYNYKVAVLSHLPEAIEKQLNDLGAQGWQLVCIDGHVAYCERLKY